MITPKQMTKYNQLAAESGLNGQEFQNLLESGELTALFRKFKLQPTYTVAIDGTLTFQAMILGGKYDWVNDDITEQNFPLKPNGSADPYRGSQEVELHLVHLGLELTTQQVLAELEKRGLRAATFRELCALGAAHPELQRQFPIVALGSRWRDSVDYVDVPILGEDDRKRYLSLDSDDPGRQWDDYYRFLAVSK